MQRAATLFSTTCAVCHGATGGGDGPTVAQLSPRPESFLSDDVVNPMSPGARSWPSPGACTAPRWSGSTRCPGGRALVARLLRADAAAAGVYRQEREGVAARARHLEPICSCRVASAKRRSRACGGSCLK
ncbi:MAG: c-type cytochrome [Archangiaceae bacterium]|nr:c-type cytochrome [Archangiaceae bacterium]